ncbi:hypothetical protein HMPREF1870_00305 [Bacteroidales bacterium KA00344]|nr:hypothetical protein HMPREF1870_00305 [Bacteroidales bacterium KA00344]
MGKMMNVLQTIKSFFKSHQQLFGLPLVCSGVILLVVFYILGLSNHNLLFLPTLLILLGVYGYVRLGKQQDQY